MTATDRAARRVCEPCADARVHRVLDLQTPGTRDGLFTIHFPLGRRERIGLCGDHAAPLWALRKYGAESAYVGTMAGVDGLPYRHESYHQP